MPVQLFTEAERARHNHFPEVMAHADLVTFFTLQKPVEFFTEALRQLGSLVSLTKLQDFKKSVTG